MNVIRKFSEYLIRNKGKTKLATLIGNKGKTKLATLSKYVYHTNTNTLMKNCADM